jgi:stage IV sporulation protein FB
MENLSQPPENMETSIVIPPKFEKPEQAASNVWFKSLISLALYLVFGYYIFHSLSMLLLITLMIIIHELGHFFAMKFFRYKDLGIFFIPLLGAYVSGSKREVSQKESAIILLAGPLPGVIIGCVVYWLGDNGYIQDIAGMHFYTIARIFIFLNLINLLPIYPLDGGQLLNRVFLDEESWISKIFIWLSIIFLIWFAVYGLGKFFAPLLIFPALMIFRMFGDTKLNNVEKKIEAAGINLDKSYEELPDEDYWKIRNILAQEHPAFKDIQPAPPYEYSLKEEKVMNTVESLLHRHLIQDVSLAGKLFILVICLAAFASPWLLNMDLNSLRFG